MKLGWLTWKIKSNQIKQLQAAIGADNEFPIAI